MGKEATGFGSAMNCLNDLISEYECITITSYKELVAKKSLNQRLMLYESIKYSSSSYNHWSVAALKSSPR